MYRVLFKNKETGEEVLFWRYFTHGRPHYFKDVSLTDEVDISEYDKVDTNNDVVNIPTPYQLFGIECERGWYPLLQPIMDYIDNYNKDKSEGSMIYVTQVKEKFGTLRFYTSFTTPELSRLIEEAEVKSENVCEFCGTEKNVGSTLGWYITICHDCVKKRCIERGESIRWCNYSDDKVYWIHPDKEDEFIETTQEYEESLP